MSIKNHVGNLYWVLSPMRCQWRLRLWSTNKILKTLTTIDSHFDHDFDRGLQVKYLGHQLQSSCQLQLRPLSIHMHGVFETRFTLLSLQTLNLYNHFQIDVAAQASSNPWSSILSMISSLNFLVSKVATTYHNNTHYPYYKAEKDTQI